MTEAMSEPTPEGPQAATTEPCEHSWQWVSPAGTNHSARLCQLCGQPDPDWLNEVFAERLRERVEALADELAPYRPGLAKRLRALLAEGRGDSS